MNTQIILLIAKQFFQKTFKGKGLLILWCVFCTVLIYIAICGWQGFKTQHHIREHHQEKARESWEDNPDKHPHRMAHFGTFAFRLQHPLSVFDSGLESYTGNAVFLEAHKQHTANFSEASLSTGLVRFGDLNIAMLLQLLLPLIIFFIGYSSIVGEKDNGTLKMMYIQGAEFKEILLGKSLGLFYTTALFFLPAFIALWSISFLDDQNLNEDTVIRSLILSITYLIFFMILCCITVIVSAKSKHSNRALLRLLGIWLLFFIIIPKTAQVVGHYIYPNLSMIEFKAAIERETSKHGDSHNTKDPAFIKLRDSILTANKVTAVEDLPFNFQGYLMRRGEKISAMIYTQEHDKLIDTYRDQNSLTRVLEIVNPYLAIKNISMGVSATNFNTYVNFLAQAERYRYEQSQFMNELQMQFISNKAKSSEGKVHVVNKSYWQSFSDFTYSYLSTFKVLKNQLLALFALGFWCIIPLIIITKFTNYFKII